MIMNIIEIKQFYEMTTWKVFYIYLLEQLNHIQP